MDGVSAADLEIGPSDIPHLGEIHEYGSSWGNIVQHDGRPARMFRHFGSPFYKASVLFKVAPHLIRSHRRDRVLLRAGMRPRTQCGGRRPRDFEWAHPRKPGWHVVERKMDEGGAKMLGKIQPLVAGAADLWVNDVIVRDADQSSAFQLVHGKPITVEVLFEKRDAGIETRRSPYSFARDGTAQTWKILLA